MQELLRTIRHLAGNEEVYIVGGWLRDALMQRRNKDLDLATKHDPGILARKSARKLNGSFVKLDEDNQIYRVVLKNNPELDYIDFARFKGPTIREDLKNRDFTINAMALLVTEEGTTDLGGVLDPLNGRRDLKKKVVRAASPRAFKDDPLRLLRAFRLAADLGFRIDQPTRRQIVRDASLVEKSAAERIRDELFKIFDLGCSSVWMREMERTGVLEVIFPELVRMRSSARRFYFHPLGLWQHSIETLISLERLLARLDAYFPRYAEKYCAHLDEALSFGVTRRSLLKFVALFHDVAKPYTAQREGKRTRFLGHETRGAEILADIMRRLKMSKKESRIAALLVEHHMRPVSLSQVNTLSPRASFRLFRDLGDSTPDLLLLSLSDWHSYKGLKGADLSFLKKQEATLRELIRRYFAEKERPVRPVLANGTLLMEKLHLAPGPVIGDLLRHLQEAQGAGTISTAHEALLLAGKVLTRLKKKYKIK